MFFHEIGNRVIVTTTDQEDWKLIKETIKNLDKPQPLVALECLIVTVDVTNDKKIGGQVRNKEGALGKHVNAQSVPINSTVLKKDTSVDPNVSESLLGNLIDGVTGGLGKTLLTFGRENNIWSIFELLQKQVHTSVVAQPFLTVANKYSANIKIGETRRVSSGEVITAEGLPVTGQKDAIANLEIEVTPQINIDGDIMEFQARQFLFFLCL